MTRPAFAQGAERTGRLFYDILFEIEPDLRALFPDDRSDMTRKFVATFAVIIDSAKDTDTLRRVVVSLARRHVGYAVEPRHYEVVGRAFLETLRRLGASRAQLAAWSNVYDVISAHMVSTAYSDLDM